jgi:hypothetical protein
MTLIEKLQARKKTTRHWLHWIGIFITFGFWLLPYIVILAFRAIHNRDIDSQINGAALALDRQRGGDYTNEELKRAQIRADFDDNLPLR